MVNLSEYIKLDEDILIEGWPTAAGPVFHISGISKILHYIMTPTLCLIAHIVKDSSGFTQRLDKQC